MKTFGVFLIILGLIGGVFAFQMDTSVSTGYSEYSPTGRVSNLSLMEERRTYLMVSGLSILAGVLLFGFGSIRSSGSGEPNADSDLRACPFCAEHIKKAATVCRFCNRDVPQIVSTDGIGPSGEAEEMTIFRDIYPL
jgi:hypothetical protein